MIKPNPHHEPSRRNIYVVGFSGGKDSLAVAIYLIRVLKLRVVLVFADTGHESPLVYEYLDQLERDHGFRIIRIRATLGELADERVLAPWKICSRLSLIESPIVAMQLRQLDLSTQGQPRTVVSAVNKIGARLFAPFESDSWRNEPLDMKRLAIIKRRFPSATRRFCTTFLKLLPQRNWLTAWAATLSPHESSSIIRVSGVRAQESAKRATHKTWGFDDYMQCWMWLPIHGWAHQQVFDIAFRFEIPINPLYRMGMGRVGCFPCINATKSEIYQISKRTDGMERLHSDEVEVAQACGKPATSFFSNDKTPTRFHSHTCEQSGKSFPDALDVKRWAMEMDPDPNQLLLFKEDELEDSHSCSSIYGLCE